MKQITYFFFVGEGGDECEFLVTVTTFALRSKEQGNHTMYMQQQI